jgi:outer membrane protein OmpA-like peptidoglycan-associated protein
LTQAQPVTGPYVSLAAGTSILNPENSTLQGEARFGNQFGYVAPGIFNTKTQFRPDYAGIAGVGYGFGDGFRIELDGDYIRNTAHSEDYDYSKAYTDEVGHRKASGAEEKYGPMLNLLYDIPVGLPVYPYIGAGVGYQFVKFNPDISSSQADGTEGSFAYDIIGGLSYPLPALPQLSLTAEYRFMQLTQSRNFPTFQQPTIFAHVGQESSHTFTLGLRYQLFAPPVMAPVTPAPMASPAPTAAKTYLVFFDWDKYSLTPRATQIIAEAASDSKTSSVTTIDVSGYTDTSGTPTYNQGLSERRAKAVAAKLVSDGVPASEISIHAYGETHLLVPTGPGVREPQNRRVEIVLN